MKWIIDLNTRAETIKLSERTGKTLWPWVKQRFFRIGPKRHEPSEKKIINWNSLKLKTFALQKILLRKQKDKPRQKKVLANYISEKGFAPRIYNKLLQDKDKPVKKMAKRFEQALNQEDT